MKSSLTRRGFAALFAILLCFLSMKTMAQCNEVHAYITNGPSALLCTGLPLQLQAETNAAHTFYQWQKQTATAGSFTNIDGANSSILSTDNLGSYRVIVGNGTCKDTSSITNIIALTLSGGTISGGPATKICADSYVGSLAGPAVPGDEFGVIKYQWQLKEGNGSYQNILLATGLEFNAGYVKVSSAFRRAAIDKCGNTAYSNELTFTTYDLVKAGTLAPALQSVVAGGIPSTISASIAATGSGNLSFKWQSSLSINGPWTTIENATGASYTPGAVNVNTYLRRIAFTDVCSYTATTEAVVVTVQNPSVLNAGVLYSDNSCLFSGNTPYPVATKIKPVGGVQPYIIEWESKTVSGAWTLINGEHNDKLFPGPIAETTSYRKKVTDAMGTVAYTDNATLSVISGPLYAGEIFAASSLACMGFSPGQIISTKSGANFGERGSYQWQIKTSTGNWTNIYGAIRGYYQPQPLTEKSQFRRVFFDSCGRFGRIAYSNVVEIDAKPALLAGDIGPSTQVVIPGRMPGLLTSIEAPNGGTGSYTIWWEKADLATGPWTKITNASGVQYQPEAATKTTYYRRVVRDNNCHAEKITFVIEVQVPVYPPMIGGNITGSTCVFAELQPAKLTSGSIAAGGGIAPYTFQWEKRTGTNTFTAIVNATGEQYQPGILTETTQYRRKVTDSYGTAAYSNTFTIQLVTTPLIPGKIEVSNPEICAGSSAGIIKSIQDASGLGSGAHYQWQQRTGSAQFANIAGAISKEYTPSALMQTTYFRRAYSDECSGIVRTGYSNEVVIKATPSANLLPGLIDGPFITCYGTAPGNIRSVLDACGSCNLKYQWEEFIGTDWVRIEGATSASFTPASISNNTRYRRKVTDGMGRSSYSNIVEILVYPGVEAGTIGVETQTVCMNANSTTISLLTDCHYTDGTVTYLWQQSSSKTGPWTDIVGANTPAYQPEAVTATLYYRLKVMSTTCHAVVYTNVATVALKATCSFKIAASSYRFQVCQPDNMVKVFVEDVQTCNNENEVEWQVKAPNSTVWMPTGINTLTLNVNGYYKPEDAHLEWRLKIYNKACNTTTYSNVVSVSRVTCRKNLPIVYPNPVVKGQIITVETTDIPHKLSLMTIDGKKINFRIISTARGFIKIMLPTVVSGTYVLQIKSAEGQWVKKIIVKS